MQQAQCIQVVGTYPLAQEGVDIRQTCPLPAGGTGEDQGQAATLSVAEVTLFPQQTLVLRRQPDKTQRQRDDVQWLMYVMYRHPVDFSNIGSTVKVCRISKVCE